MNSRDILYSKGKNDECLTPDYAVVPILEYIPPGAVVWCPFDHASSAYVRLISRQNPVFHSHIASGRDFFKFEPDCHWDMIVSNPPYTNKRQFFERALSFYRPFALLMSNTWLNDAAPKRLFRDRELQLLMFEERIKFERDGVVENRITFSTSYYCWSFLPKQIIMKSLKEYKNE